MRQLDRYILKNVLSWTLQSLMVLLFIFVIGGLVKEFRTLLVESDAGVWLLLKFVLTAIPLSLEVALPLSFLIGNLVTFGQLSTSSEITSMRMAGISIKRIALPVLLVGLSLSVVSIFVNSTLVPTAKSYKRQLLYEAVKTRPEKLLQGELTDPDTQFTVDHVKDNTLHNLNWTKTDPQTGSTTYHQAAKGELTFVDETQTIAMNLHQVYSETKQHGKITERSWSEFVGPLNLHNPKKSRSLSRGSLTSSEIRELLSQDFFTGNDIVRYQDEISTRHAISWACLALAFLGIPLSLASARQGNSTGFIISIVVSLIYFVILEAAKSTSVDPGFTRTLFFWIPNISCAFTGAYLIAKKEAL